MSSIPLNNDLMDMTLVASDGSRHHTFRALATSVW